MTSPAAETVVIAGGTGFLGLNLARCLTENDRKVVLISRTPPTVQCDWIHEIWDGRSVGDWARHLEGAAAVVNLAGRSVDCIKTPDHCDQILRSRVEATRAIGLAIRRLSRPPRTWVQMSTAHIYGDPPNRMIEEEESAFGYGLAPQVGIAWEKEFRTAVPEATRGVVLRTSFVLGRNRGALRTLAFLTRLGLGGTIGHGRQGMSWLHEDDMNALFLQAITNQKMAGTYLATSPNPVSNREFMKELRRALNRPIGLPAAQWMVRLAAPLILRTDPELALYGRYCRPGRLLEEGYVFRFPELRPALQDLFDKSRKSPD